MSTSPTPAEEPDHSPGPPLGFEPLTETDPRLIGPYRLVGRIGAGGMGVVYAALDSEGRCIALKTVHAKYADRPGHRESFTREVEMLRRADGVSTARVHGADPTATVPWLAFDYVPGRDLRRHVREFGPLPGDMLRTFALGTAEGLAALHSAGIAHRDVKPGNVILAPDGPKIVDFGIAVEIGTDPEQDASASYGTPGWSAPERYTGAAADPAADVFAWGGLVALAATGRGPFGQGSPTELAERVKTGAYDIEGIPEDLLPLVERALSVAPSERPTAVDLLAALLPPATEDGNAQAGTAPERARTQRVLRGMLADYWRGVDMAGHDPARWAVALGAASAVGVGVAGTGVLGSGMAGAGGSAGAAGAAAANTAGASAASGMSAGGATGGGALGALSGIKGIVAVLGTLTLVGTGAAAGAWYLRDEEPVEETVAAEEPEEDDTLAVDADPEDGAAVLAEAFTLAMEADSFTTYEAEHHNDVGSTMPTHYMYTRDPEPRMTQGSYLWTTHGVLASGDDLDEHLYFIDEQRFGLDDPIEREYRRNSVDDQLGDDVRAEWESTVEVLQEIVDQEVEIEYTGRATTDDSYIYGELLDDELREQRLQGATEIGRSGHHYTGTVVHEFGLFAEPRIVDMDFEVWVSDEGYPLGYYLEAVTDEPVESPDETLTLMYTVNFYRFDQPVEIEYPEEHEIS